MREKSRVLETKWIFPHPSLTHLYLNTFCAVTKVTEHERLRIILQTEAFFKNNNRALHTHALHSTMYPHHANASVSPTAYPPASYPPAAYPGYRSVQGEYTPTRQVVASPEGVVAQPFCNQIGQLEHSLQALELRRQARAHVASTVHSNTADLHSILQQQHAAEAAARERIASLKREAAQILSESQISPATRHKHILRNTVYR